jgi:mycothiol synthase
MAFPFVCEPARPEETPNAFRLIFGYLSDKDRDVRVANAVRLVHERELEASGILVARAGRDLLGAMVCLPVPGASALVWPPQVLPQTNRTVIEDRLLQYARSWLKQRGCKLAQTMLAAHESCLAIPLERNGFAHITRLWYMKHELDPRTFGESRSQPLSYRTYPQSDTELFHETLVRTYEQTTDCPELNGVRTIDEILKGHRAQGVYDPERWWLALREQRPVGVLLATEIPDWEGWDISYVGVLPEYRRQGIGCALVVKALLEARQSRARQVSLAVDQRNRHAWNLYRRLGFEVYDEKEVYLCFLAQ